MFGLGKGGKSGKNEDEDFDDVDDAEFERELAEIQAISSAVTKSKAARRSEPTGGKAAKKGGKQTVEQQLLGELGSDIDDDELEAELNALIESEGGSTSSSTQPTKRQPKNDSPQFEEMPMKVQQPPSLPVAPPPRTSSQQNVVPVVPPQRESQNVAMSQAIAPPLPPRQSSNQTSNVPVVQSFPEPKNPEQTPATTETGSTKNKAKNLLLRRREAFAANAKLAVEDGNSEYAKECAENVMMFDQALEACEEQEITMEDLEDIPKTPPPYKKRIAAPKSGTLSLEQELQIRIAKFKEAADEFNQKGDSSRARMQGRLCSQIEDALRMHRRGKPIHPESLPVPIGFEKLPPMQGIPPSASGSRLSAPVQPQVARSASPSPVRPVELTPQEQAEQYQAKALEYKKAALLAKKKGDLPAAAKYLQAAKAVEKKAEELSPSVSVPKPTFSGNPVSSEIHLTPSSKLFVNLKHQLEFTMKLRTQFNTIKDVKRTLFYDELIKKCSADLKVCHHEVKAGNDALMRYKVSELNLPTLEINPGIQADTLEIKIVSISNLRMPEGWKATDAATFVNYEFPFPHEAHQTGRSQIVYKTDNPEFNESFQMKINRKTKQLQRICQRQPIKLSVYQKGGFLRSDKFCGEADIQFSTLINQATLCVEQDLLDHRKKTGAQISVEIRVQKPLDEKKMNAVKTYPWIRLIDSNTL